MRRQRSSLLFVITNCVCVRRGFIYLRRKTQTKLEEAIAGKEAKLATSSFPLRGLIDSGSRSRGSRQPQSAGLGQQRASQPTMTMLARSHRATDPSVQRCRIAHQPRCTPLHGGADA